MSIICIDQKGYFTDTEMHRQETLCLCGIINSLHCQKFLENPLGVGRTEVLKGYGFHAALAMPTSSGPWHGSGSRPHVKGVEDKVKTGELWWYFELF